MNFGQQVPGGGAGGGGSYPHPQQGQRPNNFPMLPPQLANLSAQQLNHLKNQPQFQTLMRNYIQSQQINQQQRQQQMYNQQHPQQPIPRMNPGISGMNPNIVGPPTPNMGIAGAGATGPRQPQQVPIGNNFVPQRNISGASPGFVMGQQSVPPHIKPPINQAEAAGFKGGLPVPSNPPIPNYIVPKNPQYPPQVYKELASKVQFNSLSGINEWSEKLKAEGKQVPTDVKVYEGILNKDSDYMINFSKELHKNKRLIDGMARDIKSYAEVRQLRMKAINRSNEGQLNNSIWGEGYQGYGNGLSNTITRLVMPPKDLTDQKINELVSKEPSDLVPIRLDFDQERDRFKLRDTFLWDLNEKVFPLENFVQQLIQDFKFIPKIHYETILSTIRRQIQDYNTKPDKTMGELRILIKIDITINNTQLLDQFEWDILNSNENDPEDYAMTFCDEMSLPGEFATAISHSIREQSQLYLKALNLIGYSFDGSTVNDDEIRTRLLPSLRISSSDYRLEDDFYSILRNPSNVSDFSPSLVKLTHLELERLEKEIERESRRKRRHNAPDEPAVSGRGGTSRRAALHNQRGTKTLPDLSDVSKTVRTPVPSSILPGGVDLGATDVYDYNEAFVYKSQMRNAEYDLKARAENRVKIFHNPSQESLVVKISFPTS